jgi:hypothetical protein
MDWQPAVDGLLNSGVRVYVFDDIVQGEPSWESYSPPQSENFCRIRQDIAHFSYANDGIDSANRRTDLPDNIINFVNTGECR